ncbi:MAG: VOC family protein [Halobacteriaceae archaeon]
MLHQFEWLALEVTSLERAREFYTTHLNLTPTETTESEVTFETGGHNLLLRRPTSIPRGGLHVHYAFATPDDCYQTWYDSLSQTFDLQEVTFGEAKSLYFFDPDGHCVEIGQRGTGDDCLMGLFEIVFEVRDLESSVELFQMLGFKIVDKGDKRRRVRLSGPIDVEIWEPQLGIADARGGVHMDVGFSCESIDEIRMTLQNNVLSMTTTQKGLRVKDENGHYISFVESSTSTGTPYL